MKMINKQAKTKSNIILGTFVNSKNNHAITLIALIITIIILLILAGVTINVLIGENGLFNTAKTAGEKYKQAGAREKLEAVLIELQADKITKPQEYNENEYINNKIKENKMTVNGDLVTVDGWQFLIDRTVPELAEEFGKGDSSESLNAEKVVEYGQDIPLYEYLKKPQDTKFIYNELEVKSTKDLPVGEWIVTYNKETKIAIIDNVEEAHIEDLSGYKHNLYLKNGTSIKQDEQENNYLSFDGQNDYAQIMELEETIDWANGFTIEFEATWEAFNSWSGILGFRKDSSSDRIVVQNNQTSNGLTLVLENGSNDNVISKTDAITLNEKLKYVIKYEKVDSDNYKVTFQKNNEEIYSTTGNYKLNNIVRNSNYIGATRDNYECFQGKIYSLKITQANGTTILWYDINKYLEKYETQTIKVMGNSYIGSIADISGKEHTLYQKNGAQVKIDEFGKYYLSFDGQDDYAQIMELEETIDWANGFTIEFEATWEAFNSWSGILGFRKDSSSDRIVVQNNQTSNGLTLLLENGSNDNVISKTDAITLNEKSKYVIKYEKIDSDNYKVTFQKNNEEIYSTTGNYKLNNTIRNSNYIGSTIDNAEYFKGKIYSLKITQSDKTPILWYDINKWLELNK